MTSSLPRITAAPNPGNPAGCVLAVAGHAKFVTQKNIHEYPMFVKDSIATYMCQCEVLVWHYCNIPIQRSFGFGNDSIIRLKRGNVDGSGIPV